MLERLARFSYRRRWAVLAFWVVVLIGVSALASAFGGETSMEFKLPASDSQEAFDLLKSAGTGQENESGKIVFAADDVTAPDVAAALRPVLARLG